MAPKLAAIEVEEGAEAVAFRHIVQEELLARLKLQPTQLKEHNQRFGIIIAEGLPGKPGALRCRGCKDHQPSQSLPGYQTAQHLMQAAHGARVIQPWQ
eukprot:scaffold11395_cov21-Tisochrysis_lutea.AAC.5